MTQFIETRNLARSFKRKGGENHVLKGINFGIEEGTITGLLGVNGAGKTTLIHCIMGLIKPQSGTCMLFGEESWEASIASRQATGFVPQSFDAFEWMSVGQILDYTGVFYENWNAKFVGELIDRFQLDPGEQISNLSLGMKQRVSIVMSLGHNPKLLVLDEPVAALDPVGRRAFVELLLQLHRNDGRTILFSTHILSDIERVAADVAILRNGEIDIHSNLEDLKMSYCRVHIHGLDNIAQLLESVPGCLRKEIHQNSARLTLQKLDDTWYSELVKREDVQVEVEGLNLEEIFLELNA